MNSTPTTLQTLGFMDVDQLTAILKQNDIDPSLFGTGVAKTLDQLVKEINDGETEFSTMPLLRVVRVLILALVRDGKTLVETNQFWHKTDIRDSYSRQRFCLVAEKIERGEFPEAAVRRALKEELGIEVTFADCTFAYSTEIRDSLSYPGVKTKYITYRTEMVAPESISSESFEHTEYFEDGTPRVTATWEFRDLSLE